jgi:hypothetical protein
MLNPNTNLFSKIAIAVSAVVLGIVLLCVGGTMAGWDIVGALTSDTALLVYAIVLLIVLVYVSYVCIAKFK